jgi:hypothetical protein
MRIAGIVRPILLLSSLIPAAVSQTPVSKGLDAFDPKAYASSRDLHISTHDYRHGKVIVRVSQVKRTRASSSIAPEACRVWLEVWRGSLIKQIYYDDIAPVGGNYGIFVPKKQPLEPYFIAVKEGDYDGRLLLVGRDGSVSDLPGGPYFVTPDGHYIVGEYSVDGGTPLIVVDTITREVILQGDNERPTAIINNWYQDAAGYFYREPDESDNSYPQRDKKGEVYRLDLVHRRVMREIVSDQFLEAARKVPYEFNPEGLADCTSTPQ